ncbi:MAG: hypothetical protein GX972_07580 [Amphibacillus sp.]|uniref:Putative V-type ATP synthase E subunit n=1 Tax=Amphibacillus xylanus (strain ATCC 51415 / DSM 6626 / JCM 7361 / LMG 17667 / NBRC 15112 / Ep01) TaxID=698758 RepID=K0IY78_AMPXN|nr:hypothetical protein [Amphibacillus xylanus]NMA91176.1 hypothetical protein [Amphibacillus sp.]BAM47460.1 putative V-type ATP synthase E subunit [Amphibacillus xylanus NBRC 15112]
MEDIKALSKQILAQTKEQGESKLAEYRKIADDKLEETRQKLQQNEEKQKELIVQSVNNDYERQAQTMKNNLRNNILAKKQALLNTIFDKAIEEIQNWDDNQFAEFISGVLKQIDQNKSWSIVPGEHSIDKIKSKPVQEVLAQYSVVTVSDEIVKNKAGFILEQGGIDYNFCFDILINELKKEFSPQLASLAF